MGGLFLKFIKDIHKILFRIKVNPLEKAIYSIIAVSTSSFVLFISSGVIIYDFWMFQIVIMISVFILGFLPNSIKHEHGKVKYNIFSFCFMAMGVVPLVYMWTQIPRLYLTYGSFWTFWDIFFGTIFIIAVLELTRKCYGLAMPLISLFFLLYVIFGNFLPTKYMGHLGFSFGRTVSYMFGPAAIFGVVMSAFVRIIIVYIILGAFLQWSGVADFFMDFAISVAGRWRGGPAKIAVVASALLGTINGSAVANVATTGAVTIPLMKKVGYEPSFAAAVEAAASTGGQILPPIMGTGAFIMAELLNISYAKIIIAATIPAILYFTSVFCIVDLEAVRLNLKPLIPENIPNWKIVLKSKYYLFIPIIVLIYQLIIIRMSVTKAGLYAILITIIVSWLNKETRMGPTKIIKALIEGTSNSISIAAVIALAGMIIGAVGMTGLGMRFSSMVVGLAQGIPFLVALLTAMICIFLGMGMPTSGAYIICISVAVSGMSRIGIEPLVTHLFVFYFACIATITPPVACSSFTAAGIAQSPIMKTAYKASLLGLAGYIVPFLFIFNSSLIMQGEISRIISSFITAVFGIACVAMSIKGVSYVGEIRWNIVQRVLFFIVFIGLIVPGEVSDVFGLIVFLVTLILSRDIRQAIFLRIKKM